MPTTTIHLTSADDTYTTAAGDYSIYGEGGNDTITTGAGNSSVYTGAGNSTITTGAGNSIVSTGLGNQTITTGAGDSTVTTLAGNSTITTGAGNNTVTAGNGNNTITTGAGLSHVTTGIGADTITTGAGDAVVDSGTGNDIVTTGAGNDLVFYHVTNNQGTHSFFTAGAGIDTLNLVMTRAEWMTTAVQADVDSYMSFLAAHQGATGEDDAAAFTFSAFGLTASQFEKLAVTVDGVLLLEPTNQHVSINNASISTTEETASVAVNVLAGAAVPDLIQSFSFTNPLHGSLVLNADYLTTANTPSAKFIYTPKAGFYDYLAVGEAASDVFTYTVTDAAGGVHTATVNVTINGTNEAPVITTALTHALGNVTQNNSLLTLTSSGGIAFHDIDLSDVHTASVAVDAGNTLGGTLTLNPVNDNASTGDGTVGWTYHVANSATVYLAEGQTAIEKFNVILNDGHDGTAAQTVSVTVTGINDPAVIGGQNTGSVTEDANLTAGGTLTVTDPDAGESVFRAQTNTNGIYGKFSINALGDWTYALNNNAANVQALNAADHASDHFTVLSKDGTAKDVAISVNGKAALASSVIDFEDVVVTGGYAPIPDGYKGFNWDVSHGLNAYVLNANSLPGTGYQLGSIHPGNYVAFNPYGYSPTDIHKTNGTDFTFSKVYVTGAWQVDQVTFEGFNHGILVGTTGQMAISNTSPTLVEVHWGPIDDLHITTVGSQVVFDNFSMA